MITAAQNKTFPKDFTWGVATSSYQIEGGWNQGGKGESIWDRLVHTTPELIQDCSNADDAAESYKFWQRDVELIRELGVKTYRFSISWPRIMPDGFSNQINEEGVKYYSNLIDELLKYNISPMVTMYHWDLPQKLQELGGFANPEMVNWFKDYARVLFEKFGERVKSWITFNEPWHVCEHGYGSQISAPAIVSPGVGVYLAAHNLLKAHAEVYHLYKDEFKDQKGIIGITCDTRWLEPLDKTSIDDAEASERAMQFFFGWFTHPIFSKNGNYPKVMIDRIASLSLQQGFRKSRLPEFTPEEIERIRNTSDFFGLNTYTSGQIRKDFNNTNNDPVPSFNHDLGVLRTQPENWPQAASVWLKVYPEGMYQLLMWISKEYDNPPVYITENGVSDFFGTEDTERVEYFNSYLESVLKAINEGCNIKGYIAWTLIDSFEWSSGFTETFGLYHVDFNSPQKTRSAKMSAKVYKKIVETNQIDRNYKPKPDVFKPHRVDSKTLCKSKNNSSKNTSSIFFKIALILLVLKVAKMFR